MAEPPVDGKPMKGGRGAVRMLANSKTTRKPHSICTMQMTISAAQGCHTHMVQYQHPAVAVLKQDLALYPQTVEEHFLWYH